MAQSETANHDHILKLSGSYARHCTRRQLKAKAKLKAKGRVTGKVGFVTNQLSNDTSVGIPIIQLVFVYIVNY